MISIDFDEVLVRRNSESFKWRTYPEDVLPLFVADMDFKSPAPVARALQRYIDDGVFGYPRGLHSHDVRELPTLAEIVAERMQQRYGWKITPEEVVYIPGVVPGLNLACHAVNEQGGAVLVQPPVYPPILAAPFHAHLTRRESALRREAGFRYGIDWESFEASITRETRMFILCNPHNPVGRVFSKDELTRMAEICLAKKVLICADEIHSDLVFSGHPHVPIASMDPEIAENSITFIAPSKTFNLAGLQCAFAIIPNAELRRRFQAAREGLTPWVNAAGVIGAQAAYCECQDWLDELLVYLEANRDFLRDFVHREMPSVKLTVSEGTYLAWLDFRDLALENPYQYVLDRARVALSDGTSFGTGGKGFLRLNFACPRVTLAEALNRIRNVLPPQ
jgi:cystathionine beta-lyase